MKESITTLSSKNQVVIPKKTRLRLGLKPGQKLIVMDDKYGIWMLPKSKKWSEIMAGLGKEMWKKAGGADKVIREERESWEK